MIKKISSENWKYIGGKDPILSRWRLFCQYTLSKKDDTFVRKVKMRLIIFLLLSIPSFIIAFFSCLWDGGLKDFYTPCRRVIYSEVIRSNSEAWKRADEIWKNVNKLEIKTIGED